MTGFKWTEKSSAVALALADGQTRQQAAQGHDVTERTVYRWLADPEFSAEVDRLSLMVGIASRAERLRIAHRAVRQKLHDDGTVLTDRDILDWLRFAQSETDGIKIGLTAIANASAPLAGGGSGGVADVPGAVDAIDITGELSG